MIKICLQSGHQNCQNNCDPALRTSTGAPGEAEFTVRIRDRLSQILISKGFQLFLKDANANCEAAEDYNLFLAIHYDADVYGTGGGFVDYPDPSVDFANAESKRIRDAIASLYFSETGIVDHPERSNANTRFYYMWRHTTASTPCVIIECGVGKDAHDSVILNDTDRVCVAIARGICKAFNVPYDAPLPPPPPITPPTPPTVPSEPLPDKLEQLKTIIYKKWSSYPFGGNYWKNRLRELKAVLEG